MSEKLPMAWLVRCPAYYRGAYQGYFGPMPFNRGKDLFIELHYGDHHELSKECRDKTVLDIHQDRIILFRHKWYGEREEVTEYEIGIDGRSFSTPKTQWKICSTKELAEIWLDDVTRSKAIDS